MKRLFDFIKIPTTRDVLINTIGNFLVVFFTALYALALVRILSPAEYGVLSVLFGIAYVLANILDFGVTASIYSYLPPILSKKDESMRFIKTNFLFQTILASIVLIIFFIFIKPIDKQFLKLNVPTSYFLWTFLSVPLFIWQNFVLNILYASKRFLWANVLNNVSNFLKMALLFVLVANHAVTIPNIIIIFGIVGPLVFFSILLFKRKELIQPFLDAPYERGQIRLRYTLTYFLATQLFNMATRVDLFMISFYLPKTDVGYYGLSQKIILTVLTAVNSITQVLSPQFSNASSKKEVLSLVKKGFIYMLLPTSMFAGAILLPSFIYGVVFTQKFLPTSAITKSLSAAFILYSFTAIPTLFFLYTIKKPVHLLITNILFLLIVSSGCFLLIPSFKLMAPPIAFAAAFIVISSYIGIFFVKEVVKMK